MEALCTDLAAMVVAAAGVVCWLNLASNPGFKTTGPSRTGMSDASGWDKPQYYSTIQFADINGDGKADLCGRDSQGVQCSLTNAAGTGALRHDITSIASA